MAKSKRAAGGAASNKRARTAADKAEAVAATAEQQQQQDLPQAIADDTSAPAATSGRRRSRQATAKPPAAASNKRGSSVTTAAAAAGETAAVAETDAAKAAKPAKASKAAAKAKPGAAGDKPKPPFYLIKSEPHEFSWDDLQARPNQTEGWEGVRNYVARNHLRAMQLGDRAFFYHSSCKTPGIVGIVEVVREAYPDLTAQDKSSKYHDPKASPGDPRWSMVDFKLVRGLRRPITLEELKGHKAGALSSMALFTTARLSVQPVSRQEWDFVLGLERQEP